MRKVLLASTALVALGSVSAMAADISISGSSEMVLDMGNSADSDDSSLASETDVNITFSNTSDSGITTSLNYGIDEGANNDDMIVSVSGLAGMTISYTNSTDDHALTAGDIEASGTAEERAPADTEMHANTYTGGLPGIGANHVTVTLPSLVDGLTIAGSLGNTAATGNHNTVDATTGEAASYRLTYDAGVARVVYGEVRGHTQTDTHLGVSVPLGAATIMIAQNSNDEANVDNSATLIGVTYALDDALTLGLEMDKGENGTAEQDYEMTSIGATYVIAPGLSASLTSAETDSADTAGDEQSHTFTSIGLHVSF
jgi:hypothetical protein